MLSLSFQDACNVLRFIGGQKRRPVNFRDNHPHLVAEKVQFEDDHSDLVSQIIIML